MILSGGPGVPTDYGAILGHVIKDSGTTTYRWSVYGGVSPMYNFQVVYQGDFLNIFVLNILLDSNLT